jgi:CheY-like chemotaxis protein
MEEYMSQVLFFSSDPVLKKKNMEVLSQAGLQVSGVDKCLEGLIMLDKNDFDLIVIDEELADITGYEACLKVRQQSDTPIVLLGSVTETEVWAKVEELGFDLYLRKPVSPRELLVRVKALLRRPPPVEKQDKKAVKGKPQVQEVPPAAPRISRPNPTVVEEEYEKEPEKGIPQRETQLPVQEAPAKPAEIALTQPPIPPQAEYAPKPPQAVPPLQQPYTPPPPQEMTPIQPQVVPPQTQYFHKQSPVVTPQQTQVVPMQPQLNVQSQTPISQYGEVVVAQPRTGASPQPVRHEATYSGDAEADMIADARTLKLIDALVTGKLTEITPVIDITLKLGYVYPSVDSLTDTTDQDTVDILEALEKNSILIKRPFEKLYTDPEGLLQLVPLESCTKCNSGNIARGQLVEHFSCGYVGLDREFSQESRYVCPKCHKELRLIGTDYRNIGIHYRCLDCNEVFASPVVKWRNLRTRKIWNAEELKETVVYSYTFSPDKKGWLEFQLKPKTELVEFLRLQGYQVQELAQLAGSSGAMHTVDILARRDDVLAKINLGIGILVAPPGEAEVGLEGLFKFDTTAYDIGINYKVVIAIPRLSQEAINFANKQIIRAFEAKTLGKIVSDITGLPRSKVVLQSTQEPSYPGGQQAYMEVSNARATIIRFLRNRGYEVFEMAKISGKSGTEHVFDIYARRDDKIITPTIAVAVVGDPAGQPIDANEIAQFDSAAYDAGIRNKAFLGIPKVTTQAKQIARQQKIEILEWQDLGRLV